MALQADSGAQSQQLLASGEAPIGFFWNGRLSALAADGMQVGISWDQNITAADALVVPKGAKNNDAAMKFIAEATSAEGQAAFAAAAGYASVNLGSGDLMDPAVRSTLPDAQTAVQVNADMAYWAAIVMRSATAGTLGRHSSAHFCPGAKTAPGQSA